MDVSSTDGSLCSIVGLAESFSSSTSFTESTAQPTGRTWVSISAQKCKPLKVPIGSCDAQSNCNVVVSGRGLPLTAFVSFQKWARCGNEDENGDYWWPARKTQVQRWLSVLTEYAGRFLLFCVEINIYTAEKCEFCWRQLPRWRINFSATMETGTQKIAWSCSLEKNAFAFLMMFCFSWQFQLSELQKENVCLRAELERETTARETLQLQVNSKDQLLSSFRSQTDVKMGVHHPTHHQVPVPGAKSQPSTPGKEVSTQVTL